MVERSKPNSGHIDYQEIRQKISSMSEDELILNVIIPYYSHQGYKLIKKPNHGPGEHGKDIIFKKQDDIETIYIAIQAKAIAIKSKNIGTIIDQARSAYEIPFINPITNQDERVSKVYLITSKNVSNDAQTAFSHKIPDKRYFEIIDGERLLNLYYRMITEEAQYTTQIAQVELESDILHKPHAVHLLSTKTDETQFRESVDQDIEQIKKQIDADSITYRDGESIQIKDKKMSETIPFVMDEGTLIYQRERSLRDTTKLNFIPTKDDDQVIKRAYEQIDRKEIPEDIDKTLSDLTLRETRLLRLVSSLNGVDIEVLDYASEALKLNGDDFSILDNDTYCEKYIEELTVPRGMHINMIRIKEPYSDYLSILDEPESAQYMFKIMEFVHNDMINKYSILLGISSFYEIWADYAEKSLIPFLRENAQDVDITYYTSKIAHHKYSLLDVAKGIIDNDNIEQHYHETLFNFGSSYLEKNFSRGVDVKTDDINFTELTLARTLLVPSCDSDENNSKYLSALAIADILLGDFDDGMTRARKAIDLDETNINALNAMTIAHFLRNEIEAALFYTLKIVEHKPDSFHNLMNMGNIYKGLKQFEKALNIFLQAYDLDNESARVIAEIGVAHQNLGHAEIARDYLDRAIDIDPNLELAWLGRGDLYLNNLDDYYKAAEAYEKAISINPDNMNAMATLAQTYSRLGEKEKAHQAIIIAESQEENNISTLLAIGSYHANEGNVDECISSCGLVLDRDPKNTKGYECIGIAYFKTFDYETAIEYFEKGLSIDSINTTLLFAKALALINLKNDEDAIDILERIRTSDPYNFDASIHLAKLYTNKNAFSKALEIMIHLEIEYHSDSEIKFIKGVILANLGQIDQAVMHIKEAIYLESNKPEYYVLLSRIFNNSNRFEDAKSVLENASIVFMDNRDIQLFLGITYIHLDMLEDAHTILSALSSENSAEMESTYYLAEVYIRQGELSNAETNYNQILQDDTNNVKALLGLARVELYRENISKSRMIFKKLMRNSQGSPNIPYTISQVLKDAKQYDLSIKYLNKAIRLDSDSEQYYLEKAKIYHILGKGGEATKNSNKALKINPNSEFALFNRGYLNLSNANIQKAIDDFSRVVEINPSNNLAWYNLGVAYGNKKDNDRAQISFESALRLGNLDANMHAIIGDFYNIIIHDSRRAIREYKRSIDLGRSDVRIKVVLANCYLNIGLYTECISLCNEIINVDSTIVVGHIFKALSYTLNNQFTIAFETLNYITTQHPDDSMVILGNAVYYTNVGEREKAIEWGLKGVASNSNNSIMATIYHTLGLNYYEMHDYDNSIKNLEKAININPLYSDVLKIGGVVYYKQNEIEKAIEWWTKYVEQIDIDSEVYYYLSLCYNRINNFEEARNYIDKSIEIKHDDMKLYDLSAQIYRNQNKIEEAIETIGTMKTLSPDSPQPYSLLGDILFNNTREMEDALREYQIATEKDPSNWKVWANMAICARLLKNDDTYSEYVNQVESLCPSMGDFRIREINVYLVNRNFALAKEVITLSLHEYPDESLIWYLKGVTELEEGQYENAYISLRKSIELDNLRWLEVLSDPRYQRLRDHPDFPTFINSNQPN